MVLAFVATALLGFAVGLFSFKVKLRWCRECGALLTCPECSHPGAHVVIRRPS